jgi:hypothetical protein
LKFEMQDAKLYAFQFTRRGDLDGDGVVGYSDLRDVADAWLWSGPAGGITLDVDYSGQIDFRDFVFLALKWLETCP